MESADQQSESAQGYPPPKPPGCLDTTLVDLTDPSGVVHDVRIVKFGQTKLFIPTNWISKGQFIDQFVGKVPLEKLGQFIPDIHKIECPGVIHTASRETPIKGDSLPMLTIRLDGKNPVKNLTSQSIFAIFITENVGDDDRRMRFLMGGGFKKTHFVASEDVFVFLSAANEYPPGGIKSQSLSNLFDWLGSPPSSRDNSIKFELKADTRQMND
ncbi:MAG: hypothetical protein WBH10_02065 [Allopontixanthobacter sediminis]